MNKDQDTENAPISRNKLRSSLKRTKIVENTTTNTATLAVEENEQLKQPRRVSFASNTTVKPFVQAGVVGEQEVWDDTYQEEINQSSTLSGKNFTKGLENLIKSTCTEMSMEFSCQSIVNAQNLRVDSTEKENIPIVGASKVRKIHSTALRNISTSTVYDTVEMEFTCLRNDTVQADKTEDTNLQSYNVENVKKIDKKLNSIEIEDSDNDSNGEGLNIELKDPPINDNNGDDVLTINDSNDSVFEHFKKSSRVVDNESGSCLINCSDDISLVKLDITSDPDEKDFTMHAGGVYSQPANQTKYSTSLVHIPSRFSSEIKDVSVASNKILPEHSASCSKSLFSNKSVNIPRPILKDVKPLNEDYFKKFEDMLNEGEALDKECYKCINEQDSLSDDEEITELYDGFFKKMKYLEQIAAESDSSFSDISKSRFSTGVSKSLHETIVDFMDTQSDSKMKLQYSEENYYIYSMFFGSVFVACTLDKEDGHVIKTTCSVPEYEADNLPVVFPDVFEFIIAYLKNKIELDKIKSCLGSKVDVLSFFEHGLMLSEKCFQFLKQTELFLAPTDDIQLFKDGTLIHELRNYSPLVVWTITVKLASIEHFESDFLVATSKYGNINEEYLKDILRNTESGLDCMERFTKAVDEYFKKNIFKFKD